MKSGFLRKPGGQKEDERQEKKRSPEGANAGPCRAEASCEDLAAEVQGESRSWRGSSSVGSIRTAAKQDIISDEVQRAVEIGWDNERGNIALAKRDYRAGEIVFSDAPIMVVDVDSFPPGRYEEARIWISSIDRCTADCFRGNRCRPSSLQSMV